MTFFSMSDSGWRHSLTISRSDCRERILTSSELRPTPNPRRTILVLLALNVEDSSVVIGPVPGQTDHPRRDSTRPARQISKRSLIPLPSACGEGVGKLARKSRTPTDRWNWKSRWKSRGHPPIDGDCRRNLTPSSRRHFMQRLVSLEDPQARPQLDSWPCLLSPRPRMRHRRLPGTGTAVALRLCTFGLSWTACIDLNQRAGR